VQVVFVPAVIKRTLSHTGSASGGSVVGILYLDPSLVLSPIFSESLLTVEYVVVCAASRRWHTSDGFRFDDTGCVVAAEVVIVLIFVDIIVKWIRVEGCRCGNVAT